MSGPETTHPSAPATLPILPLRHLVVFPGVVVPIEVGRAASLKLLDDLAAAKSTRLALATQTDPSVDEPGAEELHPIGVVAEIVKVIAGGEGRRTVVVRAVERVRFARYTPGQVYPVAEIEPLADVFEAGPAGAPELEALAIAVRETAKEVIARSPEIPDEAAKLVDGLRDPARLADLSAQNLDLTVPEKVALLAEPRVVERLRVVLHALQHRVEVLKVKERIDGQVRDQMASSQREAVLRQKLKAIQEELGEGDEGEVEGEYDEKIKAAGMPEDAEKVARKQLARLGSLQSASPEYTVTRTYLDWMVDLPWSKCSDDAIDLAAARKVLDEDHYELEKVKKRILEYLAVRKLAPHKRAPILCLVGPPGVGKTSLGKSIARALGRQFVRLSLGGVRDEAEIRGHRRTYIGALPGRILQSMKRAGTRNPVMLLDEVDKLGADFRGDPSSALLEVLDPEQNNTFSDHYLEVPYDLSQVIFIATANQLDPIPDPLLDRMEIIELPGYTLREKQQIAARYLVPKQLAEHGLGNGQASLSDAALDEIIEHYTREAGVRNLEREIASAIRGVAVKVATGETFVPVLGPAEINELLGPPRFQADVAERTVEPGVATGLAWTPSGGDILFIEATSMPGKGGLVLTGQLGSVMKESAQAALSYVRSRAPALGIDSGFFEKIDVHVHVPAGGIPKDGPSAGNAILSAMVSLFTGRRVHASTAMTGEITLRGNVLPVGGIKEKVLAAHRAGIKRVILPERNRKDLIDVPAQVREELEFVFVRRMEQTIAAALEPGEAVPAPVADPLLEHPVGLDIAAAAVPPLPALQ